jgi:periplasmic copper chaperone A
MRRIAIAAALAAATSAGPALAHEVKAGDLTLSKLAVRASLGAAPNTAGYLTIANTGARPDRLLSVSCACARKVEMHASTTSGGMATMTPTGPVAIPAGASVAFAPGGLHLMVMGLTTKLNDGAMQEMTLRFERAGTVKATFHVKAKIDGADHKH